MTRDPSCFLPGPTCVWLSPFWSWGMLHISPNLEKKNILLFDLHFFACRTFFFSRTPSNTSSTSTFARQDGHLTWGQFATSFMWPPSQLGDFALGMVTAQIWGRWTVPSILGDVVLVALLLVLVMLPSPSSRSECQNDGNALLSHASSLAIAIFMLASPKASVKPSGLTRLLSHPALVALGKYSFEVYLFQWPLQAIFRQLCQRWPTPETFMAFLLLLWFISGLYVELLVMPLTQFCRSQAEATSSISVDVKGSLQSEQS